MYMEEEEESDYIKLLFISINREKRRLMLRQNYCKYTYELKLYFFYFNLI